MYNPRTTYALILAAALAWCGAIVLAPLLADSASGISRTIYAFFHPICHQYDIRSLHVAGHPLAVCSRCSAIYFAFLAGVILFPVLRGVLRGPARGILIAAALPMVLDVMAGVLGIYQPSNEFRLATGAVFGFVAALIVLPDAIEGTRILILRVNRTSTKHQQGDTDAPETQ